MINHIKYQNQQLKAKMGTGKIIVAGIGPGSESDITPAVLSAIRQSDVIVGYKYYFRFIEKIIHPGAICIDSGMKREKTRAEEAYNYAAEGKVVTVISSGDAGIYGMAPLIYEMQREKGSNIPIEVLPGISAFQKAASLLGAPVGHDFCVLSLSDLMTPWELIEKRIKAAAMADFITAIYNPKSEGRYWQLYRLIELFLQERDPQTPVGFVRQAGREEQEVTITTLADFDPEQVDMFTVILIGNSQTYRFDNKMITPRGYYGEIKMGKAETGIGQDIMIRSFRTIEKELKNRDIPLDKKWALLHAIHTTADFDMENILRIDDNAVASLYDRLNSGAVRTIITDVTMAASGIRKGALQRMGLEVKCYLQDEKTVALATEKGITRTQAGIRIAVGEHPDALFVFGNAPTALMELCDLIRKGKATPAGIIAAPVGFVHVQESKHMVKPFTSIPKLIVEGRKGGSNLAATLVNSILCYNDAINLKPGRDV
ncbi:precorrin-3B C(17)-methyltransferase [Parabacteroides faecis]|uniref:Precorrin-3B C17-methyltransferase n=2 Tax=Parabacteroides faecis TaxID=1217282 RepID=A0ABR6KJ59_9BACT|nr:precorrin-3B C17-methyltransferase [Parabacteroides faecis]GGJ85739.1 precorrin-3B C(17)-methyltransferase [Parabacteroides faecis]